MADRLPEPGSQPLIAALLDHFQSLPHLSDLSPDPLVFSAILLNLIVNRGGLIVDLPADTGTKRKSRAVQHIANISRSIFGRRTYVTSLNEDIEPHMLDYRFWDDPTQLAETIICTGIEDISGPTRLRLVDILLKRRLSSGAHAAAAMPLKDDEGTGDAGCMRFPDDFLFIWVRNAGRPDPPGWFVDQFASLIPFFPNDLPSISSSPDEQLYRTMPRDYIENLRRLLDYTHIHPPLAIHISNLLSALSTHPRLQSTLTSRAVNTFPLFVRAHRLVSAPFDIPADWEEALRRQTWAADGSHTDKYGVGGGRGGVNTWARAAGEEPPISDLSLAGLDEEDDNGWYANTENVNGVWSLCLRHRVKARGRRGEVMWLLQGGAVDEIDIGVDVKRKGSAEVDKIMDDILEAV